MTEDADTFWISKELLPFVFVLCARLVFVSLAQTFFCLCAFMLLQEESRDRQTEETGAGGARRHAEGEAGRCDRDHKGTLACALVAAVITKVLWRRVF